MGKWSDDLEMALSKDEFDDELQYGDTNQQQLYPDVKTLVDLFMPPFGGTHTRWLEVGPGTTPFRDQVVWDYLEPSQSRADKLADTRENTRVGFVEDMPYLDNTYSVVLMLNGFFQVRSDYEAILEINRVMQIRGRFIFNLQTGDDVDIIVGRVLGPRNMVRMLRQFGFAPLCVWEDVVNRDHRVAGGGERQALIVVEKTRNATPLDLNMPQLVGPIAWDDFNVEEYGDRKLYIGHNIDLKGREGYLA